MSWLYLSFVFYVNQHCWRFRHGWQHVGQIQEQLWSWSKELVTPEKSVFVGCCPFHRKNLWRRFMRRNRAMLQSVPVRYRSRCLPIACSGFCPAGNSKARPTISQLLGRYMSWHSEARGYYNLVTVSSYVNGWFHNIDSKKSQLIFFQVTDSARSTFINVCVLWTSNCNIDNSCQVIYVDTAVLCSWRFEWALYVIVSLQATLGDSCGMNLKLTTAVFG